MSSLFNSLKNWWTALSLWHKILFSLFLVLLVSSRFYLLNKIPVGIHYDELVYMLQAKALSLSGSDLIGHWQWWKLMPLTPQHAELTTLLLLPGQWLAKNPLLAGRLVPAFFGITLPFIIGLLAWNLWRDKKIAWATIAAAAFNPLLWQISRMGFDSLPAIWLSFLVVALLTLHPPQVPYRWLSIPLIFLAFFQYQGFKILLPIWILVWGFYAGFVKKTLPKKWAVGLVVFTASIFLVWYAVLLPSQGASSRADKTIFFDSNFKNQITNYVTTDRRLSLDNPASQLAYNKIQETGQYLVKRYLTNFDLNALFIAGEPNLSPFSVWSQGFFYLVDLPLLAIGLYQMFARRKWRSAAIAWLVLFLISPLPLLITTVNDWMIFRGAMGYMLMLLPIGIGLQMVAQLKQIWLRYGLLAIYGLFVLRFGYDYFYRYPLYSTNGLYFEQRVLASYIARQPADTPITVYTEFPEFLFYSYLYYQQLVSQQSLPMIRDNLQNGEYAFGNVRFTDECVPINYNETNGVAIAERGRATCLPENLTEQEQAKFDRALVPGEALSISSPLDSGEIFWLYGDNLCQDKNLTTYINARHLSELNVEQLTNEQFCHTWIKDLRQLRAPTAH